MTITLTHPVPGSTKTDAFGWRAAIPGVTPAQLHTGQDWAAALGTPIYAAHAGRVNRVWFDRFLDGSPAGGNMLQIGSAQVSTRYAHLSRYAVAIGTEVRAGQLIGYVGTSGASTGAHLHFELLLPGGQFVDPIPYLIATPALTKVNLPMPVLIRHPNTSIGFVSDAGELDPISDMHEVNSLLATVVDRPIIQLQNPQIWDVLTARTERLRRARE